MPLFEYECRGCGHHFEYLTRDGQSPSCPACKGVELQKQLSVFAALKGSLFAIDDEHLLEFRHRFGAFHPFRVPKELGGNSGGELALAGER